MRARALAIAIALAAFTIASPRDARAACTEAGACSATQYCALPDGGAVTDGGAGKCAAEPCVVKSDCPGAGICDTSLEPHRCVGCRDTADCLAPLVCDLASHSCVVPAGFDAGTDAGVDASTDGGADAGGDASDAAPPPRGDAGADAGDASDADASGAVPEDLGELRGGSCDCATAAPGDDAWPALLAPLALGLAWLARRRARS